jgi:hypothetical protein
MRSSRETEPGESFSHRAFLRPPFPTWFLPFWLTFLALLWSEAIGRQLEEQEALAALGERTWIVTAFGVAGRFAVSLLEAAFYRLWWRSARGASLPFWAFFNWLMALSVLDLLADGLRRQVEHLPALGGWIAPLTGVAALHPSPLEGGLAAGFGSVGLLTLARVMGTAAIQRSMLGSTWKGPLSLTFVAWGFNRVVVWWVVDLITGRSARP